VHATPTLLDRRALRRTGARADQDDTARRPLSAYGLGNALSFPLSVGASVVLMAGGRRPTR
jgi:hypothetical protein